MALQEENLLKDLKSSHGIQLFSTWQALLQVKKIRV